MLAFLPLLLPLTAVGAQSLIPQQDITLTGNQDPLEWLGANSPYFTGPEVQGISSDLPSNCVVDQAAYVVRHGSRYPDPGAYSGWQTLHSKIQNATFTSRGTLAFLPSWQPVLTNPTQQISMESITGYKELYDMGVSLRFRYPTFYTDNTPFYVWANDYPRVIQTAQLFARGYMGPNSTLYGNVVVVNSKNNAAAIGNSLAPSDLCPAFDDTEGGNFTATFDSVYLPPITKRLNDLIRGNLVFTDDDVSMFPYLCGFESQITGKRSPWCGVFTIQELKQYEYRQDLRYWYGTGPGTKLEQTMMLPFLNSLISLLTNGPNKTYTNNFAPPPLIMSFANDGQINELASAIGVFDQQKQLPANQVASDRLYISSHFVSMRGTIAFERLSCSGKGVFSTPYVRIRLNDAVYPVPSCQSGPGKSCLLSSYAQLIQSKVNKAGDWVKNCNATNVPAGSTPVKGASFLTNLSLPWLRIVKP